LTVAGGDPTPAEVLRDELIERGYTEVQIHGPFVLARQETASGPVQHVFRAEESTTMDLTDELLDGYSADQVHRKPLPHKERVRLTTMVVLAVVWALIFFLNIGFALLLSDKDYKDVGATLNAGSSLVAGFLGAAIGYYFADKD
jgi:hypothetical protein